MANNGKIVTAKDTDYSIDNFRIRPVAPDFSINKGELTGQTIKLKLRHQGIMCTCAQWASDLKEERDKYGYIFLEPAGSTIVNAGSFYDGRRFPIIIVEGRFYEKEGFPEGHHPSKGDTPPAKVFRYNKIKVLKYVVPSKVTPPVVSSTSRFQRTV